MKALTGVCRSVAVLIIVLFLAHINAIAADKNVAQMEDRIENTRVAWSKFLAANCSDDDTEETIRKLMQGKYREVAGVRANSETHGLLFLIDDFHQVEFGFLDKDSRLMYTPRVEPKGQWLRMPSGYVRSIPTPAEVAARSNVAKAALDYVVKHTNRRRDSLSAGCMRGDKAYMWDVVVAVKSLAVDSPSYVLEITNAGAVVKGPFKDDVQEKGRDADGKSATGSDG